MLLNVKSFRLGHINIAARARASHFCQSILLETGQRSAIRKLNRELLKWRLFEYFSWTLFYILSWFRVVDSEAFGLGSLSCFGALKNSQLEVLGGNDRPYHFIGKYKHSLESL